MKHIRLVLLSLGMLLLSAGRNGQPHIDRDHPDPIHKSELESAFQSIQENCHHNYKISYYTNTKVSRTIGENNELAWSLFKRGDLECDYRGACLYMVDVNEQGDIRFLCGPRSSQDD